MSVNINLKKKPFVQRFSQYKRWCAKCGKLFTTKTKSTRFCEECHRQRVEGD